MPDADDEVDDERRQRRGEDLARRAADVRSGPAGEFAEAPGERDGVEHIVAHPRAEGNVPAPPVVGERRGKDRAAEVLRHIDAEQARDAAGNVDAAGKIAVELDAVEQNAARDDCAAVGAVVLDDGVDQHGGPVGDDELFEVAPQAQLDAEFEVAPVEAPLGRQLRRELVIAADGPLYHLREEGDEQAVAKGIFLRVRLSAVHVNHVADGLKDEIGQAHGHDKIPPGQLVPEGGRQGGGREVPVFHQIQKPEAQNGAHGADALFDVPHGGLRLLVGRGAGVLPGKQQSGQPGDGGDEHEPHGTFDPACEVEHHARQQQHDPLELLRHQIIEDHARCHEPDEGERGKRHLSSACSR